MEKLGAGCSHFSENFNQNASRSRRRTPIAHRRRNTSNNRYKHKKSKPIRLELRKTRGVKPRPFIPVNLKIASSGLIARRLKSMINTPEGRAAMKELTSTKARTVQGFLQQKIRSHMLGKSRSRRLMAGIASQGNKSRNTNNNCARKRESRLMPHETRVYENFNQNSLHSNWRKPSVISMDKRTYRKPHWAVHTIRKDCIASPFIPSLSAQIPSTALKHYVSQQIACANKNDPRYQGGLMNLSPKLSKILKRKQMYRFDVIKRMCDLVRKRNLLESDGWTVRCDKDLEELFGSKRFNLQMMIKKLKDHMKGSNLQPEI